MSLRLAVAGAFGLLLSTATVHVGAQVSTSLWVSSGGAVGETAQFEIAQTVGNQPFIAFWSFARRFGSPGPLIVPVAAGQLNAQGRASFPIVVPNAPTIEGLRIKVFAGNTTSSSSFLWPLAAKSTAASSKVAALASGAMDPTVVGLADGRFVLTGGWDRTTRQLSSAVFIYDPRFNRLSPAGSLTIARQGHVATTLSNGRVFLVGGGATYAEVYDPATAQSTRLSGTLPGFSLDACVSVRDVANPAEWAVVNRGGRVWVYELATGAVSTFVNANTSTGQAVVAIPGKPEYALVGGGLIAWPASSNAVDVLNLRTRQWSTLGSVTSRSRGKAVAIGRYLIVAGGLIRGGDVDAVDLFDTVTRWNVALPRLSVTRNFYFAVGFASSGVLRVAGGIGDYGSAVALVEEISVVKSTPLRPVSTPAARTDFTFGRGGSALCIADADVFYLP